jgi:RND family efflux transporter MFP subunit
MKTAAPSLLVACALASAPAVALSSWPQPTHVRASRVGTSGAEGGSWVAATLQAGQRATLSTRTSATVRAVAVDEGARVRKGQLLVALADGDLRAQVRAAQSAFDLAVTQERRTALLVEQKVRPRAELDAVRAQREQAAAALEVAKTQLSYTRLLAPFDGRVQSKRVSAGDLVSPGQPLLELEGAGLEVVATLSEGEAPALAAGQRLAFSVDGRDGQAEVIALAPGGDSTSHRRLLRARILTPRAGLRSGAFARLRMPGQGRSALTVPQGALVERGDLSGVFVVRDGRAELRWLALGEPEGERVPVRAGLRAGELVVDDPSALADGMAVEVSDGR